MTDFLGVLGGMGPLATAAFLSRLAEHTPAAFDQDHIPVVVYGDCTIPDRTEHLVGAGPSPLPGLLKGIRFLDDAGVRAICVPCNTAHQWFDEMAAASSVPLLHIVRASAGEVRRKQPDATVVGVLSTSGTHRTGIYERTLVEMGFSVLSPTEVEFDELITPGIAAVKANRIAGAGVPLGEAADRLVARGAQVVILGCTEIPLGLRSRCEETASRYVDSNDALAKAAVEFFSS